MVRAQAAALSCFDTPTKKLSMSNLASVIMKAQEALEPISAKANRSFFFCCTLPAATVLQYLNR